MSILTRARYLSKDGQTVAVNSEAGITALQQFVDLVYEYHVSSPEAGFDTWQGFGANSVAVLPTGSWHRIQGVALTGMGGRSLKWPASSIWPRS